MRPGTNSRTSALATLVAGAVLFVSCARNQGPSLAAESGIAWQVAPSMLHARAAHAVVANDKAIFALAGTGADGAPVLEVEKFDGNTWTEETRLPGDGLNAPAAVAIGDNIYLIGGFNTTTNSPTDRVWIYDTTARLWSEATSLPAPRGGHVAVVHDGRIHVLGGGNSQSTISDHSVYDPKLNVWNELAPLPRAEGSPAAVAFWEDYLYVIGGRSGPADFGDVDIYEPATNQWFAGPAIDPRATVGAVACDKTIYVIGGESQSRHACLNEVLRLSESGTWELVAPMPTARNFARSVYFKNAIYVIGGSLAPQVSHAPLGCDVVERFDAECQ